MAGLTDRPTRQLLRNLGAGLAVAEMLTSDMRLWQSRKSQLRLPHADDHTPSSVQIAGNNPVQMAQAAQANVAMGAHIIDINMGCPAKKVCKKAAGSALLADPKLVTEILTAVVAAVDVPVTLKIRTGNDPKNRNGVTIAKIAEAAGIQALAVHGRTRACGFTAGTVEYDTIAAIKQAINIPVVANGDINTPQQALAVLQHTQADGIMLGRGWQGNPWLFQDIKYYLCTGKTLPAKQPDEVWQVLQIHLTGIHQLYGEVMGPRIARKHIAPFLTHKTDKQAFFKLACPQAQLDFLAHYFANQCHNTNIYNTNIHNTNHYPNNNNNAAA